MNGIGPRKRVSSAPSIALLLIGAALAMRAAIDLSQETSGSLLVWGGLLVALGLMVWRLGVPALRRQ
jgi:hypothetical protein